MNPDRTTIEGPQGCRFRSVALFCWICQEFITPSPIVCQDSRYCTDQAAHHPATAIAYEQHEFDCVPAMFDEQGRTVADLWRGPVMPDDAQRQMIAQLRGVA